MSSQTLPLRSKRPGRLARLVDDPRWCRGIAACAAVVAALVFLALLPPQNRGIENTDYPDYYEPVARSILDKTFFHTGRPGVSGDFRYPIGFPLMLAGIFVAAHAAQVPENRVYLLFTLLCAALAALLVFEIGCWFWSTRGALFAGLVWCAYPLWLWTMKQPSSETPFAVVLLGSVLVLLDLLHGCKRPFVKSGVLGILYACAMLVRPMAIFLPLLGAVLIMVSRRGGRPARRAGLALVMAAAAVVTIAPWELWMQAATGRFLPLSNNGPHSMCDGLTFAVESHDFRSPLAVPPDVAALMDRIDARCGETSTLRGLAAAISAETMHAPLGVAKLALIKAGRSWYGTNSHHREDFLLPVQLLYLALCAGGMTLLYTRKREARLIVVAVLLHVLYFWIMTILFLSTVRYMVPVMPLVLVFLPGNLLVLKRKPAS